MGFQIVSVVLANRLCEPRRSTIAHITAINARSVPVISVLLLDIAGKWRNRPKEQRGIYGDNRHPPDFIADLLENLRTNHHNPFDVV